MFLTMYVTKVAAAVVQDLLPTKSRRRHKKALKVFSDLFKVTKINALAEAVLLSYFREWTKTYKPSSSV
jgi:hypothetical protein